MAAYHQLQQLCTDVIHFIDSSGELSEPIRCKFSEKEILVYDEDAPEVEGIEKVCRVLPSGKHESYEIVDVQYKSPVQAGNSTLIPGAYKLKYRKMSNTSNQSLKEHYANSTTININGSHGFQIGDGNVQQIISSFSQLAHQIDCADVSSEEKEDAKMLRG